jgi:hypothetical protein
MVKRRGPPGQGWKTFLRNHAPDIAAMDLFVVPTIGFKLINMFDFHERQDQRKLILDPSRVRSSVTLPITTIQIATPITAILTAIPVTIPITINPHRCRPVRRQRDRGVHHKERQRRPSCRRCRRLCPPAGCKGGSLLRRSVAIQFGEK